LDPNVLFLEYVRGYVLRVLLLHPPLNPIPYPGRGPGCPATAANLADKFHPIKVKEENVCGNSHLVGNFF
jgi:hypothetical protein